MKSKFSRKGRKNIDPSLFLPILISNPSQLISRWDDWWGERKRAGQSGGFSYFRNTKNTRNSSINSECTCNYVVGNVGCDQCSAWFYPKTQCNLMFIKLNISWANALYNVFKLIGGHAADLSVVFADASLLMPHNQ